MNKKPPTIHSIDERSVHRISEEVEGIGTGGKGNLYMSDS